MKTTTSQQKAAFMRSAAAILGVIVFLGTSVTCAAQSCPVVELSPTTQQVYSGNTCNGTNVLPYLANGAIVASGPQAFYHLQRPLDSYFDGVALTASAGVDLALFICHDICSTYATCIAAADGGPGGQTGFYFPLVAGDYTIVVGSTGAVSPDCGSYTLSLLSFLGD